MEKKEFDLFYKNLCLGEHIFEYSLSKSFWDIWTEITYEFSCPNLKATLFIKKSPLQMLCNFEIKGNMQLICDISGEAFQYDMDCNYPLIMKFSDYLDTQEEDIWHIPKKCFSINIAEIIRDTIILGVPTRRISPNCTQQQNNFIKKSTFSYRISDLIKT